MDEQQIKEKYKTLMKLEQARRELTYNRAAYAEILNSPNSQHNIRLESKFNIVASANSIIILLDAEMLQIQNTIDSLEAELGEQDAE